MRRVLVAAAAAVILLTVAGCATMAGGSYVARGIDFTSYRTYDWGPADALPVGDARLDNNAIFQDHLQGEIEKQLAARGVERAVPGAKPDLRIHYHASVERALEITEVTPIGILGPPGAPSTSTGRPAATTITGLIDERGRFPAATSLADPGPSKSVIWLFNRIPVPGTTTALP